MNTPFIENSVLNIPFSSQDKYKYWAGGQSLLKTLIKLNAGPEIIEKYCPKQDRKGLVKK